MGSEKVRRFEFFSTCTASTRHVRTRCIVQNTTRLESDGVQAGDFWQTGQFARPRASVGLAVTYAAAGRSLMLSGAQNRLLYGCYPRAAEDFGCRAPDFPLETDSRNYSVKDWSSFAPAAINTSPYNMPGVCAYRHLERYLSPVSEHPFEFEHLFQHGTACGGSIGVLTKGVGSGRTKRAGASLATAALLTEEGTR